MPILLSFLFAFQTLQFEVASIKPSPPDYPRFAISAVLCRGVDNNDRMPNFPVGVPALGRCMVTKSSVRSLIAALYPGPGISVPLKERVLGGPDWIDDFMFNVEAKAENPSSVTESDLMSMLRHLLTERFQLQFHTETREVQGLALVVARGGPKLTPGEGEPIFGFLYSTGKMSAANADMKTLAGALTDRLGAPVADETGITGRYAISLPFIRNDPNSDSPSTVLQDHLGLRLESRKVKVEVIVIDRVERPTGN
jgi:uncharacterized protein (TIGR03435 family)